MSCKRHEPLLSALSDGELRGFAAWRLRRHLASCAHCAALYADIERINAAARTLREATAAARPTPSLANHVQHHIAEPSPSDMPDASVLDPVFERKENTMYPSTVSRRPLLGLIQPFSWQRFAVPAAAVFTIACAVGLGLQIFGTTPRAAFADVEQAIEGIQIAHIRFNMKTGISPGSGEQTPPNAMTVYDAWLRADPPGFAMALPGNMRMVGGRTGTFLQSGDGGVHQINTKPTTREDVRKALLSPEQLLENKPGEPVAEWSTPTTVSGDGHPLLRFESNQSDAKRVLFVDPVSHLPIRLEATQITRPSAGEGEPIAMEFTVDFAYNEVPPKGTFDTPKVSEKQPLTDD